MYSSCSLPTSVLDLCLEADVEVWKFGQIRVEGLHVVYVSQRKRVKGIEEKKEDINWQSMTWTCS